MKYVVAGLIFFSLVLNVSAATTIRLIIAADTSDNSIGAGVMGNVNDILNMFKDIRDQGGFNLVDDQIIKGDAFGCDAIKTAIENVPDGGQEVIVFYYSGHGYRLPTDTSKFPSFYCGSDIYSIGAPSLLAVTDALKVKRPRLVIAIADTCNVVISEPSVPVAAYAARLAGTPKAKAYVNLFENYKGVLVISSSIAGQYSWYYPDHGIFTRQLIRSFNVDTGAGKAGLWDEILKDASVEIPVPTGSTPPSFTKQDPQVDATGLIKFK